MDQNTEPVGWLIPYVVVQLRSVVESRQENQVCAMVIGEPTAYYRISHAEICFLIHCFPVRPTDARSSPVRVYDGSPGFGRGFLLGAFRGAAILTQQRGAGKIRGKLGAA
jgi:hypothetical protein